SPSPSHLSSTTITSPSCLLSAAQTLHTAPFFFDTPAPAAIYTLSLHDALPIYAEAREVEDAGVAGGELEMLGVPLGEHHGGRAAHRQARHTVLVAHAPLRGQQGRKLLHEERLPLVAVPVGVGLPVGVEARLAADREDDDRVLGIEELRDP